VKDAAILIVEADPHERGRLVEALASCCERHRLLAVEGQPRLVLVALDGPPGLDLLQSIRATPRTQSLPVIWLGPPAAAREDQDAWYRRGVNSVVGRTGDDQELRRKLRQTYDFWLTVNQSDRDSRV
jgi:hypothetical protein